MKIPTWVEHYMRNVYLWSSKSKDRSTQIGAVIIKDGVPVASGYNGLPRKVNDNVPERHERPEKYFWFEHGERNAIYNAAKRGIATDGCVMFTNGIPCADCARGVIQAGIRQVVVHKQWNEHTRDSAKWEESCASSKTMFEEAGVEVIEYDGVLNLETLKDGGVVKV